MHLGGEEVEIEGEDGEVLGVRNGFGVVLVGEMGLAAFVRGCEGINGLCVGGEIVGFERLCWCGSDGNGERE